MASGKRAAKAGKKREYDVGKGKPPVESQFKPGNQAGRGHGRPKTLKQLRKLVQDLGNEAITAEGITRLETMLRAMYLSRNATDHQELLNRGWGKVPDETRQIQIDWASLTDEQIERIERGEDVLTVLAAGRASPIREGAEEAPAKEVPET